jgi:hypothetical protein
MFLHGPLGLLPFAPISRVDPADATRIKSVIQERLVNEATRSQRDLLSAALVQLLALRYDDSQINLWRDMMATHDISHTYRAKMFRDEGRFEEAREGIVEQGTDKFGPLPAEAETAINNAIADLGRLHTLRKRILKVSSWQELLADVC